MKKLLFIALAFVFSLNMNAQVKTPQPSPFSKQEQKVGLTDVSIEYSRPNMRGRTIFGDLVPYGKFWRTGANKNTTITFSDDVIIDGQTLKAGAYAIFVKPNTESWDVVFYADTNNWGTPREWDETKVAAKTNTKIYKLPMKIETFTMSFDDLSNSNATLGMMWEDVYVGVKFEVPTDVAVVASIKKAMNGPSAGDYFSAAVYYLQEGKDINEAKTWIDKAVDMTKDKPRFWFLRQQSLIHAKAGDKKGAISAAKKSLAGAEKAGNADYVKMNKDSLKEWGAL
ncbi:DUF2911 domain-containing protein [Flavivirga algicola]|uniref:DUF2911 domain-containing protein n=1 Tax=Flavivirga algicola TaxID=2729136 RepID=A0ABX1RTZ0_9FLAO|nr:DUF2911 domain-containing protein [Flavivirga algicola]NMH86178.1 DUF2911 domain-containing protein [Flavivirga algicola]